MGLFQWPRVAHGILRSRRSLTLLAVSLFTAAYFAATVSLASLKPFSFDELTTYNIARLATSGELWRAWFESGDGVPRVVHFATHLVGSAVGFSHVTARLPDMVGFRLTCLCIWVFLSRRVSPALAVAGMLLPVTVPRGYSYAFEARGYGMVLAFSGAAVVCWDFARDTRWRRVALLGLPLCLAAAITTHAYAVLVIVPFALAELARTMEHRRVDWWPWVGLEAATLLFLPANPIIPHIRRLPELSRYSVRHGVSVSALLELWPQFLSISVTYLGLLALVCLCRDRISPRDGSPSPTSREGQPSPADWVLALGLAALPVIGWLFANLVTGLLLFRYVIAALIGFSLVIPLLCRMAASDRPKLALLLAGWVAVTAAASAWAHGMPCGRRRSRPRTLRPGGMLSTVETMGAVARGRLADRREQLLSLQSARSLCPGTAEAKAGIRRVSGVWRTDRAVHALLRESVRTTHGGARRVPPVPPLGLAL